MTKIMPVLLVGTMVAFCGCSLEKKPKVLQVTEGEDGQRVNYLVATQD